MTKKVLSLLCSLMILSLILAACSSNTSQQGNSTSNTVDPAGGDNLTQVNKLLVGSLKLEDTDQAITAEQAATLLPLWQAYRSLSSSQTAAEAEVEALLNQIQSSMSPDQVDAIDAMNLESNDMLELMQFMGVGIGARGTPDPNSTPSFEFRAGGLEGNGPPSGDFQISPGGQSGGPGGELNQAFPGGGAVIIGGGPGGDAGSDAGLSGGPMMQGTPDPSMQATAQARFGTQAERANSLLLDVLITKLEEKTSD